MVALKRIAVVFTGGTISMVVDAGAGGAVPALDGAAILARTPGLDRIAEVVAIDRGRKPASHWTFDELLALVRTVAELAADPTIDGLVFVQGTDTIEETSFLLDLLVEARKPIVVTGAMRNASEPDYDGPANLRDAVVVAATAELGDPGVVVCLAGTIEPADDVTKTHTSALDTFRSLNVGRIGRVVDGRVVVERPRGPRRPVLASERLEGPIPIVTATVAMDATIMDAAVDLRPAGIVVAATGAGNTSPELLVAAERAMAAGIPVVLVSRSPSGAAGIGYAFPGGGATWVRAGALPAGTLTAPKARIALAVGLGAGLAEDDLARFLAGPDMPAPASHSAAWPVPR
ncbi:MAG: asparaginase [Chloroflexota bacterium]